MTPTICKTVLALFFIASAMSVFTDQSPSNRGDYWRVIGITIKDGGDLKYSI